ncbi:hypothetical protein [Cognatiluteimonas weifangensis]|nr:hypothetical protein [Luteimonas weifangensis]
MPENRPAPRAALMVLIALNVALQLSSALLLKISPAFERETTFTVLAILLAVLALNVLRFLSWGALHRRYPLSLAYPASALFFPGILAMAWLFDEPVGPLQLAGTMIILAGVALLLAPDKERS